MKMIPARKEQLINPKTGETVTAIALIPEMKDNNFVKVFKLMTTKVIRDLHAGIDGAVYTLLWFIDRVQDMQPNQDPTLLANPRAIARDLGVTERTIDNHLKLLKEYGYIEQVQKRHHVYRINPTMIYKGTLKKYFDKQFDEKSKEAEVEQAPYISPDELSEEEAEEVEEEVEVSVLSGIYLGSDESSDKSKEQERPRKRGKGKPVLVLE